VTSPDPAASSHARHTSELVPIGAVVRELSGEFPEVTASKVRYLEAEGLVTPQRTARGSRRYAAADIALLRRVLRLQRDEFLPLSIIKDRLGHAQAPADGAAVPAMRLRRAKPQSLSAVEIAHRSSIAESTLEELRSYGLVTELDASAVDICRAVVRLEEYGIEPRHLRSFRAAADREIGLVAQAVAPRRSGSATAELREEVAALLSLLLDLHVALLRQRSSSLDV
jgi:DNA-binding transcriptional MerR regulator